MKTDISHYPHRRKNILTGDWVLVSPHRTARPWQGEISNMPIEQKPNIDPNCYLCPGNKRSNGKVNPQYKSTYVFTNDFSALLPNAPSLKKNLRNLLISKTEKGICRVLNFSPRHDLTLAEMKESDIAQVITAWQEEFRNLGLLDFINSVQIFENKGAMMGNSNPHPHCQIWAQESIPVELEKETKQFKRNYLLTKRSLLAEYIKLEMKIKERLVYENTSFVILVPFWAVWPYETIIIPKRKMPDILSMNEIEKKDFANAISVITIKYDNLFKVSFPYSSGLHQAPTDGKKHDEWHFHMHFYPPLLRSAKIKKFMVGYEMLAEPQRDISPECSAQILKGLSLGHYKKSKY